MITQSEIENYVEQRKSGACLEVFSSIVGSKSRSTRKAAMASAGMYCEKVLESFADTTSVLKTSVFNSVAQNMDVDTLISFVSVADLEMRNKGFVKTIMGTEILRNLAIRLASYMYDLDYARVKSLRSDDRDLYYEVGDAIFLAGMYLALDPIEAQ